MDLNKDELLQRIAKQRSVYKEVITVKRESALRAIDREMQEVKTDYEKTMAEAELAGAKVSEIGKAYGTKDRKTITDILDRMKFYKETFTPEEEVSRYSWGHFTWDAILDFLPNTTTPMREDPVTVYGILEDGVGYRVRKNGTSWLFEGDPMQAALDFFAGKPDAGKIKDFEAASQWATEHESEMEDNA